MFRVRKKINFVYLSQFKPKSRFWNLLSLCALKFRLQRCSAAWSLCPELELSAALTPPRSIRSYADGVSAVVWTRLRVNLCRTFALGSGCARPACVLLWHYLLVSDQQLFMRGALWWKTRVWCESRISWVAIENIEKVCAGYIYSFKKNNNEKKIPLHFFLLKSSSIPAIIEIFWNIFWTLAKLRHSFCVVLMVLFSSHYHWI